MTNGGSKIIAALDMGSPIAAAQYAKLLRRHVAMLKVGFRLFMHGGPAVMRRLVREMGFSVFLDLKFPGIPSEVREASAEAVRLGAAMFTVNGPNGNDAFQAAREGVEAAMAERAMAGRARPIVLGTTVLTSQDYLSLLRVGLVRAPQRKFGIPPYRGGDPCYRKFEREQVITRVIQFAELAQEAGLDGAVTSADPEEIAVVRMACGPDFKIVATSVNTAGGSAYDQKRAGLAGPAIHAGADYVVVGRMLLESKDAAKKAAKLAEEIATALAEREEAAT